MQPLVDISPGETMLSGVALETENEEIPVWASAQNVYPDNGGLSRYIGASVIDSVTQEIQAIIQHFTTVPQAVVLGPAAAWKYTGAGVQLIDATVFTQQGLVTAETWGTWVIANNGKEKPQVWKNTGNFDPLANFPFASAIEMIRRQPYMLALGTIDPVTVSWCHTSDPEQWTPTANNAAGDFTIRDIPGAIMGGCPLGEATAIYSRESLTICSYLGPPNYFGFNTTLSGIGIYGPKSVCAVGRKNYGIGPQGPFVTDGYDFELLGTDAMRRWISKYIDESKPEKILAFHNELLESIEFRFQSKDGLPRGILYKLGTGGVYPIMLPIGAASERDVFSTALVGVGMQLCRLEKTLAWAGQPVLGKLSSKFTDAGQEGIDKIWQTIRLDGKLDGLQFDVDAMFYDPNSQEETAYDVFSGQCSRQLYFPFGGIEALKARISFEGTSDWHLSRVRVYGETTGLTI